MMCRQLLAIFALLFLVSAAHTAPTAHQAQANESIGPATLDRVCGLIKASADRYKIPAPLLARLLWTESKFNVDAADNQGRRGIAEIVPSVARERKIKAPHDLEEAIPSAAAYIGTLRDRFGNDGLAVAAYKLGEKRLATWISNGGGVMPTRIENFVYEVTLRDAQFFMDPRQNYTAPPLKGTEPFAEACRAMPKDARVTREHLDTLWGAVVAGNFRRSAVLKQWGDLVGHHKQAIGNLAPAVQKWETPLGRAGIYAAKVYTSTRGEANEVCDRIHSAGGACIVLKNDATAAIIQE